MQVTLSMTAADFGFQTTLRTERPEDARVLSGLVDFGVAALEQEIGKDISKAKTTKARADAQKILALLKSLGNTARERDLTLSLSVAQATVADFVKQMSAPAPAKRQAAPPRRGRAARPARGRAARR
jgi:uncharacterized protein (DUF885 family)